jgi:hypothetical protein
VTGRIIPARIRRQAASVTVLAVSLLTASVLSPAPAATAAGALAPGVAGAPVAALKPPLTVSLTTVTPAISVPKAPITITGTVRNAGRVSISSPVASALIGQSSLTSRQAVSDWATAASDLPLVEVATTTVGKSLAPGAVARFTLTIAANAISRAESFAVLPVRVEVAGTTASATQEYGDVHTFLPTLATIKRFVPLSIAWLVPLTLDPDPALLGNANPARTAAWTRAVGPGSRLDRLIQGTAHAEVTWAIDPAILGPSQAPAVANSATPSPTSSPSQSPTQGSTATADPVRAVTSALAARLKAAAPRHILWSLPYGDPDLAALLPVTSGNRALTALVSHPSSLDVAIGPARADIAWLVAGTLTPLTQARLRSVFATPGLTASVTSASTLSNPSGPTPNASSKSTSGLPLLAYDESLSSTVAQTSSKATGAVTIQRFLADSMALLGERPGTPNRSVLVAEPRTFAGDPTVLRSLFAAVAKAPWLIPTTTEQLLAASEVAPEVPSQGTTGTSGTTTPSPTSPAATPTAADPLSPGTSPLTSDQLATIPGTLSTISGIDSILGDGHLFASTWTDAQTQELSVRWRNHPGGLTAIDAATRSAINTVSSSVRVSPSGSVNFFADRGVMQVTVVNDLAVPIHDVRLTMTPAQPRLRIEPQPGPLRIGAKARANVPLQVTAIAAGLVDVKAALTTPNGTPLGQNAIVTVRVQPPATWIYWVLGALAGMVLVLGTLRSLRRGSTRASRPDAQEPPVND